MYRNLRPRLGLRTIPAWLALSMLACCGLARADGGTWPPVGELVGGTVNDIAFKGTYAYVAADAAVDVIDISVPSAPLQVAHVDTPGSATGIGISGNYAYVTVGKLGVRVINIANPLNPAEVGSWAWSPPPTVTDPVATDIAVGTGYAYVGYDAAAWAGVVVVSIATPAIPATVAVWEEPFNCRRVTLSGHYLYVCGTSLSIVDVADPSAPFTVDTWAPVGDVAVSGDYAYVAMGVSGIGVLDVSDPANVLSVASLDTAGTARGVALAGSYLYVADSLNGLRDIVISDPLHPAEVGGWDTPGVAAYVARAGSHAYVGDGDYGLRILNVSNPAVPAPVAWINPPSDALDVAVSGNTAYVANGDAGLRVVDVSNPALPARQGWCETAGNAVGVVIAGDYAFVADSADGLRVVYVGDTFNPAEVASVSTAAPVTDVAVSGGFAYVTDTDDHVHAVDAGNPLSPTLEGSATCTSGPTAVVVTGDYVYVATASGLDAVRIDYPPDPMMTGHLDLPYACVDVAIAGRYAYVADLHGVRIVDIGWPSYPTQVGYWGAATGPRALAAAGGRVYVADGEAGLRVLDVTEASAPIELGVWDTPGLAVGVAVADGYVYVADDTWGLLVFPQTVPGEVSGQVRVQGTPTNIAGATVRAYRGDVLSKSAVTGGTGIYAMAVPASRCVLKASAAGYLTQTKADILVRAGDEVYVNFGLSPSGRVSGQVKARATDAVIPGATITVSKGGQLYLSVTTNTSGVYVADRDLPTGTYVVGASKPGFLTQTRASITITAGQTTYVNFFLDRLCIKGQVRAAGSNANLAGATVQAYEGVVVKASATADASGIYELGGLAPGIYTVVASAIGYVRQTKTGIAVVQGEVTYVNFSLAASGKLEGQVKNKDNGQPIIGATVIARMGGVVRAKGSTKAPWGLYEIPSDLPPGTYSVGASKAGYLGQTRANIVVTAGNTTYVNFSLEPQ